MGSQLFTTPSQYININASQKPGTAKPTNTNTVMHGRVPVLIER